MLLHLDSTPTTDSRVDSRRTRRNTDCAHEDDVRSSISPAVATSCPEATHAATEILEAGGNAVDAAVAAAWVLAVCEPAESGLGGQTIALIRYADGRMKYFDGCSAAPAAASPQTIKPRQQEHGYRALAVPTTPLVLDDIQRRFGLLSRADVMHAAIEFAQYGFKTSRRFRGSLKTLIHRRNGDRAIRGLFLKGANRRYRLGETVCQPKLAATLERLAQFGSQDFYRGQLARQIIDDVKAHGGLLSSSDLAGYEGTLSSAPICSTYRGHLVATAPPPAGGLQLLQGLRALEQFDLAEIGGDLDCWRNIIASTCAEVLRQRDLLSDHPQVESASFYRWLLSRERAQEIAARAQNRPFTRKVIDQEEPGDTTHLCVIDSAGCMVSITQSIQSVFGAKVANAELGFVYNNYLCTLGRSGAGYVLEGRSVPRSNVAPTVVFQPPVASAGEDGHQLYRERIKETPLLTLGAAGSRRIFSALLQVICNVVDRHLGIVDAVSEPRVHGLSTGSAWVEAPAVSGNLKEKLSQQFAKVRTRSALSRHMGAVQAIEIRPDGSVSAAADPRRHGVSATLSRSQSDDLQKPGGHRT